MKNKDVKVILFYAVLIIAIVFFLSRLFTQGTQTKEMTYSDVLSRFASGDVVEFVFSSDNDLLTMKFKDGTQATCKIAFPEELLMQGELRALIDEQIEAGTLTGSFKPATTWPWWASLLPYVIVIVLFIGLWIYMVNVSMGKGGAGKLNSFGKARVKMPNPNDKNTVLFKDVAGADEEKAELEEVVEFLKNPAKYGKLGAKIPHGVLLVGPPGTGKTLLAKAVAGEAGVPFFSISGSDFVEMYVGVGASRVRDLFETARKAPASIVFIDEIDAVGRHRGAGLGGGHDEREQTLNQLLVEMDGFGSHDGIIVIAATNRPDILDPALLRPGRFDRQITVNYPDIRGRVEILRVHARNKPIGNDVDFNEIAKSTVGFTGADLANLLNEAALLAARHNKSLIDTDDIEEAYIKVIAGPKKKSMVQSEKEKKNTAYHEAGHAIVAWLLPNCAPVQQISIIPSGKALGYTLNPPTEDKHSVYKQEMKEKIAELLGGRAAEELIFGDFSGGASNDIERATSTARNMVTKLGMSDLLGPIKYGSDQDEVFLGRDFSSTPNYSDEVAAKIDSEIHAIVEEAHALAKKLLSENMEKLHFIASFLVKNEIMDGDQFRAAMESSATVEELEEIAAEKKRKRREASDERQRQNEAEAKKKEQQTQTPPSDDPFGFQGKMK